MPRLVDVVKLNGGIFNSKDLKYTECCVLKAIGFELNMPLSMRFLDELAEVRLDSISRYPLYTIYYSVQLANHSLSSRLFTEMSYRRPGAVAG